MKVSCLQENLIKGLETIMRTANVRTILPMTSAVLLATENGRLKLTANNLEMAVICWLGAKVDEEGAISVPARILYELVGSFPRDVVNLTVNDRLEHDMKVECSGCEARICGIQARNFTLSPFLNMKEATAVARLKVTDLSRGINHVVFVAANEESRPILTGVYASFEGNEVTLVAADRFRLAVYKVPLLNTIPQKNVVIIPAKTLVKVDKLMGEEETIDVLVGNDYVLFRMEHTELISTVVVGTFPNYTQLIPKSHTTRIHTDRKDLLQAIKAGRVFEVQGSSIIRLIAEKGDPSTLTVSGHCEEVGDASWKFCAFVDGEDGKIAFNSQYLVELLSVLTEDSVILEISEPSSPGVIRGVDNPDYTHVLMPMFVQW